MKKMVLSVVVLLICFLQVDAKLSFREIRTASNNVIVVNFKSTFVNNSEVDITKASWTINGVEPLNIYRYLTFGDVFEHFIYLETSALVEGTEYKIHTPHGDTAFTFSDHSTYCEAIKTNQAAYSPLSKSNRAIFAIWLGEGGSKAVAGDIPEYEVFEQSTGKVITSGLLKKVGSDASSGDTVYHIDLSSVPEGGPYKIAVKGYGCSYPFGVGGDFSRRLSYVMFRGQYYQRCGCPIIEPYGLQIRANPCHSTVYDFDGAIGEANIVVTGTEPTFKCHGGYHDAGDADRRAYHMSNPIVNLMIYEAFPELFTDKQFNIPDKFDSAYNIIGKGNGIPDIIDEAAWGTLVWEYLQNDDGSVHWGTETQGYPEPFEASLDKDIKKYGTVKTDDRPAAVAPGLFLHLARLLKPYNPQKADSLAARSMKSFTYISAKMADPEKLYYYVQKYLYDGDESAHEQIKSLKTAVDNYKSNSFIEMGYSLNDKKCDNPGYFLSYIVEKTRPTDSSVVAYFKKAIKAAADSNILEWKKYAYPVGNNTNGTAWGHNARQPNYACAPILNWLFTKDQTSIDAACDMMNYNLGLNPLGISYITGIGFNQVRNPHDREFAFAKLKKLGLKPGITVFGTGPGLNKYTHVATADPALKVIPVFKTLPMERQYADQQEIISMNEFTIFQTMTHYALYTVLSEGGTFDPSKDPFSTTGIKIAKGSRTVLNRQVKINFDGKLINASIDLSSACQVSGGLFSLDGKCVERFKTEELNAGAYKLSLPVSSHAQSLISNGVYICKLNYQGKTVSGIISKLK